MLHMLRDFFRLPSSPRRTPDFTCYMCYATFRMLTVPRHNPPSDSTCYICYLAFFDSSTPGREPPHSTCYLRYLPFSIAPAGAPILHALCCPALFDFFHGTPSPRATRATGGFGFSDSLVHATYACLSCSTCSIQINVPSSVPPARRSRITETPGMPGIGVRAKGLGIWGNRGTPCTRSSTPVRELLHVSTKCDPRPRLLRRGRTARPAKPSEPHAPARDIEVQHAETMCERHAVRRKGFVCGTQAAVRR